MFMGYKIIRNDKKRDEFTSQFFKNYSDTYDLLITIYGD